MSSQSAAAAAMSSTDTKSGIPIMAAPALSTFKVGDKVLVRLKLQLLSKNERACRPVFPGGYEGYEAST